MMEAFLILFMPIGLGIALFSIVWVLGDFITDIYELFL